MVLVLPGDCLMSETKGLLFGKAQGAQIFFLVGSLGNFCD